MVIVYNSVNILKVIDLDTLNRQILWYVNYISNEIVKKKKHTHRLQNFPPKGETGRVAIRRKPLKRFFDESVMEKKKERNPALDQKK